MGSNKKATIAIYRVRLLDCLRMSFTRVSIYVFNFIERFLLYLVAILRSSLA